MPETNSVTPASNDSRIVARNELADLIQQGGGTVRRDNYAFNKPGMSFDVITLKNKQTLAAVTDPDQLSAEQVAEIHSVIGKPSAATQGNQTSQTQQTATK